MDRRKELSATEKLLDLIRAGDTPVSSRREPAELVASSVPARESSSSALTPPPRDRPVAVAPPAGRSSIRAVPAAASAAWSRLSAEIPGLGRYRNRVIAGVSLRPSSVEVAVVGQVRGRQLLQDHLIYKVGQEGGGETEDNDTWLNAPALKTALRRALEVARAGQTGHSRHLEIWTELPWRHVDVHLLNIPKVAQSEIANAVFWAARKNIEGFDPKTQILDFILSPRSENDDKQRAVVFLAARRQVEKLRHLFRSVSFTLVGITAPAMTVSHLAEHRRLAGEAKIFSHLRLEEHNSFISLYEGNGLAFSRDIKTGLLSILEAEPPANEETSSGQENTQSSSPELGFSQEQQPAFDLGLDSTPAAEPTSSIGQEIDFSLDDEPSASLEQRTSLEQTASLEVPQDHDSQLVLSLEVGGEEEQADLNRRPTAPDPENVAGESPEQVSKWGDEQGAGPDQMSGTGEGPAPTQGKDQEARPQGSDAYESVAYPDDEVRPPEDSLPEPAFDPRALTRLLRQLERTFDYCGTNLGIARPEQVYVSSPVRLGPSLLAWVEGELGISCTWLDPFANEQGVGTLSAAPPAGNHRRQLLAPAVGLAFSDQRQSQNFLLTYPDKEKSKLAHKANQIMTSIFIVLALGLTGLYFGQQASISELRKEHETLESQRRQLAATQDDEPYLAAIAAEIRRQQDEITALARRQQLLVLITAAQQLRPDGVALQQLRAWAGESGPEADKVQLEVRGVVAGRSAERELQLARYLRRLEASEQIRAARIEERQERETPSMEIVLSFTLQMEAQPLAVDRGQKK